MPRKKTPTQPTPVNGVAPRPDVSVVPLDSLIPDAANVRIHDDKNLDTITGSLNRFGAARSIVIDRNNVVRAGNGTVEGARRAGMNRVIVIDADPDTLVAVRRSDWTETEGTAYAIADNRGTDTSRFDDPALARVLKALERDDILPATLGFDDDDYKTLLSAVAASEAAGDESPDPDPGPATDEAGRLRDEWDTQPGQLWTVPSLQVPNAAHRILCADCRDPEARARLMGHRKAACVFTSPPYGVGIDYGPYEDTLDNLRPMLHTLAKAWLDLIVPGGFAVVNFNDIAAASRIVAADRPCEYPMALEYWPAFRNVGWTLWSRRVMLKPTGRTYGPWVGTTNRCLPDWEHLWTWRAPGDGGSADRRENPMNSYAGHLDDRSLDEHGVDVGKETHGAGMSIGIALWIIHIHTDPRDIVLEPFLGTGTTLLAAERLGRTCYATEIDPRSVAISLDRLKRAGLHPQLSE